LKGSEKINGKGEKLLECLYREKRGEDSWRYTGKESEGGRGKPEKLLKRKKKSCKRRRTIGRENAQPRTMTGKK